MDKPKTMIDIYKETLWKQFGASMDMLENAVVACPDTFWDTDKKVWYNAFHCIFWLDYFLTLEPAKYSPPESFGLTEFGPPGTMPDRVYSKVELLAYLQACREKCRMLIAELTDEVAGKRWVNEYRDYAVFEILLYNMRHVQHHAAQLNLLLRQGVDHAPDWVWQTSKALYKK